MAVQHSVPSVSVSRLLEEDDLITQFVRRTSYTGVAIIIESPTKIVIQNGPYQKEVFEGSKDEIAPLIEHIQNDKK